MQQLGISALRGKAKPSSLAGKEGGLFVVYQAGIDGPKAIL